MNKEVIKFNKGFTLVELLVVIAIIAILAVVGVTVFSGTQANARNAARRTDVEAISKAWEAKYDSTNAQYPILLGSMFAGGSIPRDPTTSAAYAYTGCATAPCANEAQVGSTYKVCATLEAGAGTFCRDSQQK